MDYTTLEAESKASQEQPPKQMQTLFEVCQQVVELGSIGAAMATVLVLLYCTSNNNLRKPKVRDTTDVP